MSKSIDCYFRLIIVSMNVRRKIQVLIGYGLLVCSIVFISCNKKDTPFDISEYLSYTNLDTDKHSKLGVSPPFHAFII